jgi:hypothetical protein
MSGPGEFLFLQFSDKKNTFAELVKSATNPPEIKNPAEIFFARQTTFKSARIVQIWRKKLPSGSADIITETAPNQQKQSRFIYTHPSDIKNT